MNHDGVYNHAIKLGCSHLWDQGWAHVHVVDRKCLYTEHYENGFQKLLAKGLCGMGDNKRHKKED